MWTDSQLWVLVGIPLLIFLARLTDVTMGTLRIIFVSRGMSTVAPLVGFVEVLVWLAALSQVMQNLDRPENFIAYALGFSAGTWVGIQVEARLGLGLLTLRVITHRAAKDVVRELRGSGFGVTSFAAHGAEGRVQLLFLILQRQDLQAAQAIVRRHHPRAFISVSDVRTASEGFIPPRRRWLKLPQPIPPRPRRQVMKEK